MCPSPLGLGCLCFCFECTLWVSESHLFGLRGDAAFVSVSINPRPHPVLLFVFASEHWVLVHVHECDCALWFGARVGDGQRYQRHGGAQRDALPADARSPDMLVLHKKHLLETHNANIPKKYVIHFLANSAIESVDSACG